jgi:hypothetical protein
MVVTVLSLHINLSAEATVVIMFQMAVMAVVAAVVVVEEHTLAELEIEDIMAVTQVAYIMLEEAEADLLSGLIAAIH